MKLYFALITFLAFSCGEDGQNGTDGSSSSCAVEKQKGKVIISCINSDGTKSSSEVATSDVLANCKAQVSDLYTLDYHVVNFGESRFASLSAKNLKTTEVFAMTSVIYTADDKDFDSAWVRLPSFEAKLPGEFKRPGNAWGAMQCD